MVRSRLRQDTSLLICLCLLIALLVVPGAGGGPLSRALLRSSAPGLRRVDQLSLVRDVYPGESIETAVDASSAGDTVVVHSGVYSRVYLTRQFSGRPVNIVAAAGEPVTVAGFDVAGGSGYLLGGITTNGQTTVRDGHDVAFDHITCSLGPDASCFVLRDMSYNLTISNSTIRGGWIGVHVYSANPGPRWVRNVAVVNNDISGATIDDIHVDGADGMVIRHNFIHDPQANDQHNDGIQSQASNNLRITQNTLSFTTVAAGVNVGTAIILGNLPAQFPDRKVTNTYVANNLVAHWQPGRALIMNGTENTKIVNNTLIDNGSPGINDPSITIANQGGNGGQNLGLEIWNNILKSIYYDTGSTPPTFFDTNLLTRPRSEARGTHVITTDPRFVDRTSYALAKKSRARRFGITRAGTPRVDIDGGLRATPPGLGARS